ncbi:MAG: hypothetical protein ABIM89_16680 [Mycobacteriales bacterium]
MADAPKRVTVTSSRPVRRAPTGAHLQSLAEVQEQSELGGVLLRSLVRAQLTLAFGVLLGFGSLVAALPLIFALAPQLARREVLGLPLPLAVLGIGIYPVIAGTGYIYVWFAERNERDFEELVRQS